ncbi:hypothetical protein M23134_01152 [Microscilla marina ATCC 23134]|uniref:Uncharacterized protein n=1 Tax=Microscilla marina ATCC 23134 TaxID=313606 RepID=A1ZFQ4_MICM2|nr:hypothetical protein M23134_01152 [Microscilla marina ATCC 23134]
MSHQNSAAYKNKNRHFVKLSVFVLLFTDLSQVKNLFSVKKYHSAKYAYKKQ